MKQRFFLFVLLCTLLLVPGYLCAAEWNFYGSSRIQTFIEDIDYGDFGLDAEKMWVQYQQTNSRIGARVKVSDQLTGRFEYGIGVNLRLLYGVWNFGPGTLLVGQAYSPLNMIYANQGWWDDTGLADLGGIYSGRNPMMRLKFGSFQIALLRPVTPGISGLTDTEVYMPRIEAKYRFSAASWFVDVAGGYNSYDIQGNGITYGIDSYIVALGGGVSFGPFYFKASGWIGENTGTYGILNQSLDFPAIDFNTQSVVKNDARAFVLVAGFTVNDILSFETGYGRTEAELDTNGAVKDAMTTWYLQSKLTLAPGVYVVPEVGRVDWGKTAAGGEAGETLYYGAKWQIDF